MEAFNSSYHISENRGMWKQRLIALSLTLMLSFMLIVAVALIVFTQFASNYFVELGIIKQSAVTLMVIGKWIILLAFLFVGLSVLFQYGPSKKNTLDFNLTWVYYSYTFYYYFNINWLWILH